MTEPRKIICHAPGERCLGCDHYQGKSDVCKYADPIPTETRKTPRTDTEALWPSVTDDPDKKDQSGGYTSSDFARTLEIETQDLAEALDGVVAMLSSWHSDMPEHAGDKEPIVLSAASAALARHRAKQPPTP